MTVTGPRGEIPDSAMAQEPDASSKSAPATSLNDVPNRDNSSTFSASSIPNRRIALASPFLVAGALMLLIAACGGSESAEPAQTSESVAEDANSQAPTTAAPTSEGDANPSTETVIYDGSFANTIAPILTEGCASCHNSGGPGAVHFPMDTAADVIAQAVYVNSAIATGYMPPWPASDESVEFHDNRSLSAEEIDAVLSWIIDGTPLDVEPDYPLTAEALLSLDEVDLALTPNEPYDGSPAQVDDYRCVIYDPELSEQTLLTGYNFVADQTEVVHHAIGFRATADLREAAEARDAEDPGAGWQCFGGAGINTNDRLVAWAPGQGPTNYPENTGLIMEPGDFIVMQIHYHYEVDAPADNSVLELDLEPASLLDEGFAEILVRQYVAPAEIPCSTEETGPLCDRDAAVERAIERFGTEGFQGNLFNTLCGVTPADFAHMTDGLASSSCDLPIYGFGEIVSVLGHQHEIGASFRMTLNPDTADERILLDIPVWSFDWQFNYYPVESIIVSPGDTVRLECSWNRAFRDNDLEPSYVLWADGTDDEMCFSTIVTRSTES